MSFVVTDLSTIYINNGIFTSAALNFPFGFDTTPFILATICFSVASFALLSTPHRISLDSILPVSSVIQSQFLYIVVYLTVVVSVHSRSEFVTYAF